MLLGPLKCSIRLENFDVPHVFVIGLDPANVFASSESLKRQLKYLMNGLPSLKIRNDDDDDDSNPVLQAKSTEI